MEGPAALVQAAAMTAASVSAQCEILRQKEMQQELEYQGVRRQANWKYMSLELINSTSPSRKEGLDEVKEARWRREYLHLIQRAGMTLKV